jgi:hypothetical protein
VRGVVVWSERPQSGGRLASGSARITEKRFPALKSALDVEGDAGGRFMAASYREQYERVKRWYGKFIALDQGRAHDVPSENYLDEIYAFFMNCYHFKDWIKNDIRLHHPSSKRLSRTSIQAAP